MPSLVLDEPKVPVLVLDEDESYENPIQASERAGIAYDLSSEHNIPTYEAQQLIAGDEPSAFGKMIGKIKDYINDKTGYFEPPIYGGPEYREENMVKTIGQYAARNTAEAVSGISLTAADVIANKITGDKTLAELVDRVTGFTPTPQEESAGTAIKYLSAFSTASTGVGAAMSKIPASAALKTILGAGLTFGSVEAAMQFSKNVTEGRPVDWSEIHFASGIGVLWGTGEVAVTAAVSGLAKSFEKHWGTRELELAKSGLQGKSLQEQAAIQQAEKIRDIQRAKDSIRQGKGVPQDLRDKYIAPPKQTATSTKPVKPSIKTDVAVQKPEIKDMTFGKGLPVDATQGNMGVSEADVATSQPIVPERGDVVDDIIKDMPSGSTILPSIAIDEFISTMKLSSKNLGNIVKNLPKAVTFYIERAANTIETNYKDSPAAKELARDAREIAYQTANRKSAQLNELESIISKLNLATRKNLGKMGQKRASYPELKEVNEKLLNLMDKDMSDADIVGYRRLVDGEWRNLRGSGGWYPQVLNDTGKLNMILAKQDGLGNPTIHAAAERMVKSGHATSLENALGRMIDWNNNNLRGTHGYFENTRIILPEEWVEFDIAKTLPHMINKNAKMIAAGKVWGVELVENPLGEPQMGRLDFTLAKQRIAAIGDQYGPQEAEALKKWVRTEFGLSNDIPNYVDDIVNLINRYETQTRLDFRVPSAIRNSTQGNVNLFTAPLRAHLKALNVVAFRKWSDVAAKLYDEALRSGAVGGIKEIVEFEQGMSEEPLSSTLGLKLFSAAEESNQIRAALISRFSAEYHIRDLAKLKEGGTLRRILESIKYASINPEGYLERFIRDRTFTNPISDIELNDIWSGKKQLTLDDVNRIMHRGSVDTQFIQDFASRSIPWKTDPFLRLGLKFKTFAINQNRLLYQEAIREAFKGTFAPLLKYMLFSAMAGEVWNLTKDAIYGGDNSLTTQLINKPEKRTFKDVSIALANDMVDGAGVGILTDMSWGIGNWVVGPVGQSGKNFLEFFANLNRPIEAGRKLIFKELAVSRDIEGLTARADKLFFNENNKFFEYKRTRNRVFDWLEAKKNPTLMSKAGKLAKNMLLTKEKFPSILPYEYAAKQITLGDVDDAADYLSSVIKSDSKSKYEILDSIEQSRDNYSPLGKIADKDMSEFMSGFSPSDRTVMKKLHKDWISDYDKAIKKAMKDN